MSLLAEDLGDDDSPQTPIPTLDEETASLGVQVAELHQVLDSMGQTSEDQKARYADELAALSAEIENTKSSSAANLQAVLDAQESELESLKAKQAAELAQITARARNAESNCEYLGKLSGEIDNARIELEESDLNLQITRVKGEQAELALVQSSQLQEQRIQEEILVQVLEMRLEAAHAELMDVEAVERKQCRDHEAVVVDCYHAQMNLETIHTAVMRRLESGGKRRDAAFDVQVGALRTQLKREKEELETEMKAAKGAIEKVEELKAVTDRKYTQQLEEAMGSISELSELLENQQENEKEDEIAFRASVEKRDALIREKVVLAGRLAGLETELAKLKQQAAMASTALQETRTPPDRQPEEEEEEEEVDATVE
jgi:hypothetical protein